MRDALPKADHAAVEQYWQWEREAGTAAKALDEYAKPIRVPQLVVRDGDRSWLFEPLELDEYTWNLNECDAAISKADIWSASPKAGTCNANTPQNRIGREYRMVLRPTGGAVLLEDWPGDGHVCRGWLSLLYCH